MAKFEINWLEDRSDEGVLAEIRRVASLTPDRRLTKRAFAAHSRIGVSAVERRFTSWSEATRRAGLTNALPDYSDHAILEDMKRVSEMSPNETFTRESYSAQGRYSYSVITRRFGGWRKALEAAGIGSRYGGPLTTERMKSQPGRTISNEDILTQIRAIAARLGKASLSGADIEANSDITLNLMYRRFGSFSAALRQAGVKQVNRGRRYTEDEVFENLLKVWTHYGRRPTVLEMDRLPSTVGNHTYIHRYGGWRKALKAFVERANSEVAGGPALDLEHEPSGVADRADSTESPSTGAVGAVRLQPARQFSVRSRAARPAQTNIKPEDRREPSIGLRFKVLQRDLFRCTRCGRSPATELGCVLHVDHHIPFSKGGKTTFENLRSLCSRCNVGKSNRSV